MFVLQEGEKADRQSWASFDIRTAQPDEPVAGLLDKVDTEVMDSVNSRARAEGRPESLFSLYPEQDEEDMIERRGVAELPSEGGQGHRILVKCLELSLALQDIEPVFASMALYDARERRKVSENFYFDMNSETSKRMLAGHAKPPDIASLARGCVLDVSSNPGDLFLVVKLEKVLQGDMGEAIEPYIREERNVEKVMKHFELHIKTDNQFMYDRCEPWRQTRAHAWASTGCLSVGPRSSWPRSCGESP